MALRKIGIISDTHIPHFPFIPEAVWSHFADVELIIHAGDLSQLSVLQELETIAPVVAVQGNVEREEVIMQLPVKREIMVGAIRIGVVHILGDTRTRVLAARQEFPTAQVVIFGHTHVPYNQEKDGMLLFNPGSANDRRQQPRCSIGKLTVDEAQNLVRGEIIPL